MIKNNRFFSCIFVFLLLMNLHAKCGIQQRSPEDIKLLVLIIASDNHPIYLELQKIWRSYMHNDPEHVEVYFMKNNPDLTTLYEIQGDTIWCKSVENVTPGLTNKTLISMGAFASRLHEFDYILRPNLSSFYVFPRLLNFLKTCPRTRFYCGSDIGDPTIASGCGFLLSPDLVYLMLRNKDHFINNTSTYDDVLIGRFMQRNGIPLIPHRRIDLMPIHVWHANKDRIPQDVFHFRVKNNEDHSLRFADDIYIHRELLKMFYNKSFSYSMKQFNIDGFLLMEG